MFSGNTQQFNQTDIVMLLTPHIVRTHEITEADLRPIYIGSQQNLGVGGPPPLIAGQPEAPPAAPVAPAAPPAVGFQTPTPPGAIATVPPVTRPPAGATVVAPPGTSPVPGTVLAPPPPAPVVVTIPPPVIEPPPAATPPPAAPAQAAPAPAPPPAEAAPPPAVPTTSAGAGGAQVLISPPSPQFRVGGGPYTVALSIVGAQRLSTVTLTLVYDPTKLRVRAVQEGSFMRAGGVNVTFTQQATGTRVDITLARAADATGASGTGVLAAVLFDAIAAGPVTMTLSGTAAGPGGTPMGLRFSPVTVSVQ